MHASFVADDFETVAVVLLPFCLQISRRPSVEILRTRKRRPWNRFHFPVKRNVRRSAKNLAYETEQT